jgi:hypothetical protein
VAGSCEYGNEHSRSLKFGENSRVAEGLLASQGGLVSMKLVSITILRKNKGKFKQRRSQWPLGLRHELSSLSRTLGSWVRIPLKAWMSVLCAFFCVYVVLCVGSGLATG